jgi:hypothetical protein
MRQYQSNKKMTYSIPLFLVNPQRLEPNCHKFYPNLPETYNTQIIKETMILIPVITGNEAVGGTRSFGWILD